MSPFADDCSQVAGEAVVVAGEAGVDVFVGTGGKEPVGHVDLHCERLFVPTLARAGSTVVAESSRGFVGVEVSNPRAPRVYSSWANTPAHAATVASGRVVAFVNAEGRALSILTRDRRKQV